MSAEGKPAVPAPDELIGMSIRRFLAVTASKTPIPGGGSVAGVVGGLSAALGEMVLAFTRGKKQFAGYADEHDALLVRLSRARGMFEDLTNDDAAAYSLFQEATSAEGEDKAQRMALATAAAIDVPRQMTALALSVLGDLLALGAHCNSYLLTDLAAAAVLAEAVVKLSDYNVRVNAVSMDDQAAGAELKAASARDVGRAKELREAVEMIVSEHV
ncbi:MAG TPA: cyclodeaminase/cyclohydrolase family protein [Phycisphaerae bacterium]|nr:cyclodeaminase/cyclohydrolase family protein [Phycisphaerae bacterium]